MTRWCRQWELWRMVLQKLSSWRIWWRITRSWRACRGTSRTSWFLMQICGSWGTRGLARDGLEMGVLCICTQDPKKAWLCPRLWRRLVAILHGWSRSTFKGQITMTWCPMRERILRYYELEWTEFWIQLLGGQTAEHAVSSDTMRRLDFQDLQERQIILLVWEICPLMKGRKFLRMTSWCTGWSWSTSWRTWAERHFEVFKMNIKMVRDSPGGKERRDSFWSSQQSRSISRLVNIVVEDGGVVQTQEALWLGALHLWSAGLGWKGS